MNEISKISSLLNETVRDGDLQNITIDLAETFSDSFLSEGLLKDIPVLGTLIGIYKSSISIHDKLLIKKLIYFLNELKQVSKEKRLSQIKKIEASTKYQSNVGEKILFIIDKCDSTEKSMFIGKLFKAYLEEKIDYENFQRGVVCIDLTFIIDLREFINAEWKELYLGKGGGSVYIGSGLMEIKVIPPKIIVEKSRTSFSDKLDYKIKEVEMKSQISVIGKIIREILR